MTQGSAPSPLRIGLVYVAELLYDDCAATRPPRPPMAANRLSATMIALGVGSAKLERQEDRRQHVAPSYIACLRDDPPATPRQPPVVIEEVNRVQAFVHGHGAVERSAGIF